MHRRAASLVTARPDQASRSFPRSPDPPCGHCQRAERGDKANQKHQPVHARCIKPDCNNAYAIVKKALQDDVMRQIGERTTASTALGDDLPADMSDSGNRRAQDRCMQEIMQERL